MHDPDLDREVGRKPVKADWPTIFVYAIAWGAAGAAVGAAVGVVAILVIMFVIRERDPTAEFLGLELIGGGFLGGVVWGIAGLVIGYWIGRKVQ